MIRKHVVILTLYTIITLVMTYPLALNFATVIPGLAGDATSFVWAMGWMKTARVDLHVNPFHTDYIFYPLGGATQLLWATSLIALASIPFQFIFGLVATHNFFYLAATVLTAWGTYLLAEEILRNSKLPMTKYKFDGNPLPPFQTLLLVRFVTEQRRLASRVSPLACFVAGLAFAFAPLRLGYGLSFFNLFNTQLIPFYILFLIRAFRQQSRRDAIFAGALLGLNAYIDFQIAAFLILFSGLCAGVCFIKELQASNHTDPKAQRMIINVLRAMMPLWFIVGIVSFFIAAPMLALVGNDLNDEGGNYIRVYPLKYSAERSYDLASFVLPNAWSALYSNLALKIPGVNAPAHVDDVSHLAPDRQSFVGYIVLALSVAAVVTQWRRSRFWFFIALLFALFSLGPSLHALGNDTGIPLPFIALHEIPIVNHIRIPMRYGIMVSLALALLAAIAIQHFQRTLPVTNHALRFLILLLPILILAENANLPYPLQPLTIPRIYDTLARIPGDFTILEIPTFHWRGAAENEVYQAIHGKRILRAYTNRIAPGPAEYFNFRATPIIVRSLRVLEGAEVGGLAPEDIAEDKRVRDDVVRFFDLRYAILHRSYLTLAQWNAIDNYLREVLNARVIAEEGDVRAYEIPRAAPASSALKIDLRENSGQMYAGRGWQFKYPPQNFDSTFNFVYAAGAESEIYFVGAAARAHTLTLNAYADPPQHVDVLLNDARVGGIDLNDTWQDYRIALPARAGMNCIDLKYSSALTETIGVTTMTIE